MKRVLAILVSYFAISSATFANSTPFLGHYRPDPANCHGTFEKAEKVIITEDQSNWLPKGTPILKLQSLGRDQTQAEILLGTGQRQYPGTTPEIHGNVTQSWKTEIKGQILKSVEVIKRASTGYVRQDTTILKLYSPILVLETTSQQQKAKPIQLVCRLIKE